METGKYDRLKIENQICFPLYACSKEVIRRYKPLLDQLDLTYTQYITMLVLWEKRHASVKELGQMLYLDSGTLTPVLKKLESKNYIERRRSSEDERSLIVTITSRGEELRERALEVPGLMAKCVCLEPEEARALYALLYKILRGLDDSGDGCGGGTA